ncbi:MAG TPA: carboxypeptidase regulatory-like domain-containing protein [Bryobacteraceae bacterium]|nr:carboxypeptidase regulatory-like domain-containing protein [Bryobacteraceae bacterium]
MTHNFLRQSALAALLFFAGSSNFFGQLNSSATLAGTVTDKSNAVISGVQVKVSSKETGLDRSTSTTANGTYQFDLLPAGHYEVRVAMTGFTTGVFQNVVLAVGRTTTIDASLAPSQQNETITVESSGAGLVDLQKTDVSVPVSPAEVQNLPTNGRDFVNLAILAPGARPVPSYDPTKSRIGVFATNGSSGRNVNVTINGVDDKDNTVGGPVMQLPLEAIDEFNISTQRFSAANGRSEGAAVNVITKSGTNDFHGSLFFFDRESAFNTLNYFEKTANGGDGQKSPFSRQQFGGSIGGPIKKDKTFIFFAIERQRESTSLNVNGPAQQELALITSLGAKPVSTIPTPYFDWRYNGRLDHRINDKNNLSVSYSNQNNTGLNDQASSSGDLSTGNFTTNQLIIANATLNTVISPTIVNSFTAGYQYWHNLIATNTPTPNLVFPSAQIGTSGNVPQENVQRKWQWKDDIAFEKGKHSLKTGVDFVWIPKVGGSFGAVEPTVTFFDDPSTMINNTNGLYPQGIFTPGAVQSISQPNQGDRSFSEHAKMFGVYFQDDWKIKSNLTINLGLRWDKDYGLNGGYLQPLSQGYLDLKAIGSPYAGGIPQNDNLDFSPRIGIAYDLKGNGKHIFRAGYGIYFGQTFQNIPLFMEQQANSTIYATSSYNSSAIGDPAASVLPSGQLLSAFRYGVDPLPPQLPGSTQLTGSATVGQLIDPNYRNPYSEQANFGYTWNVTSDSFIEAEYVHELGLHESKTIAINPQINGVRYTSALLQNAGLPVIGRFSVAMPIGRSRYDGMNLSYRRRFSKRFSVNATYTLSQSLAYNGNSAAFGNQPTLLTNWFSKADFGPTPSDERHRFTVSGIIQLPWHIQVAPILQAASGRPYTAYEGINDTFAYGGGQGNTHAIVLNSDSNNLLGTVNYTASQLQSCIAANTCHQVSYDSLRGNAFFQLDARVSRIFNFGEKAKLELIFQAFDLTNHANFGSQYQTSIRAANFGQPTNFVGQSSTIIPKSFSGEFGAKFSF